MLDFNRKCWVGEMLDFNRKCWMGELIIFTEKTITVTNKKRNLGQTIVWVHASFVVVHII